MNYKRLYDSIIENALKSDRSGYTESHHIIPRSLGGSDDLGNLVKLTAKEHFICHYLLTKIYDKFSPEWLKMNHAFHMMNCATGNQERYFNSRLYEATREGRSLAISVSQTGKGNSQSGTMWINNGSKCKKIKKDDAIPDGWKAGRVNVHSQKHIEKLRMLNAGKTIPMSVKSKMSKSHKGKKHTEITKANMSFKRKQKHANVNMTT